MHNVTGFFAVLAEWSRAERLAAANDNRCARQPTMARCAMTAETIARALGGPRGRQGMDGPLPGA